MAYFPYGGKSIFYEEFGQGSPVLFLHGNTASSKMFELLMPLYAEKFRCILLDFLGNGRSDRVERFSPDLWQEEARQIRTFYARFGDKLPRALEEELAGLEDRLNGDFQDIGIRGAFAASLARPRPNMR